MEPERVDQLRQTQAEIEDALLSLRSCNEALRDAIADARSMMEERDAAVLKANILADGAFHDGKERSRLTDWTTELRAQVSALTVERDEARANAAALLSRAAKCPLSLSHEWSCPLLEPSRRRARDEELGSLEPVCKMTQSGLDAHDAAIRAPLEARIAELERGRCEAIGQAHKERALDFMEEEARDATPEG